MKPYSHGTNLFSLRSTYKCVSSSSIPFHLHRLHSLSTKPPPPSSMTPASSDHHRHLKSDDVGKIYQVLKNEDIYMESSLDHLSVNLTNELVLERLHRIWPEEKLALRFFTWAGKHENYTHDSKAYNTMIDILSSTRYKVEQFRIVYDMLDYMKRNDRLRKYTECHLTHLQKFVRKKRMRVRTQLGIDAFNMLLDALCKCSLVEEADRLFRRVGSKIKADGNPFNILLFGW